MRTKTTTLFASAALAATMLLTGCMGGEQSQTTGLTSFAPEPVEQVVSYSAELDQHAFSLEFRNSGDYECGIQAEDGTWQSPQTLLDVDITQTLTADICLRDGGKVTKKELVKMFPKGTKCPVNGVVSKSISLHSAFEASYEVRVRVMKNDWIRTVLVGKKHNISWLEGPIKNKHKVTLPMIQTK